MGGGGGGEGGGRTLTKEILFCSCSVPRSGRARSRSHALISDLHVEKGMAAKVTIEDY